MELRTCREIEEKISMQLTVFWGGELADGVADQLKQEAPDGFEVEVVAMQSYGKSDLEGESSKIVDKKG